jgi:hypothetical protein
MVTFSQQYFFTAEARRAQREIVFYLPLRGTANERKVRNGIA